MANEITVIGQGRKSQFALFFRYDILAPIQVGVIPENVVPTPATPKPSSLNPSPAPGGSLPEMVLRVIGVQEIIDLDNGDAAFEIASFKPVESMSIPDMVAKAREIYAVRKAEFLARYVQEYSNAGARIDEV